MTLQSRLSDLITAIGADIKLIKPAVTTTASAATLTPAGGSINNQYTVTALAVAATISAPSGTPAQGNQLVIRIDDNGTARALTWNAIFRWGQTMPTTTVAGKTLYVGAFYNSSRATWDVTAVLSYP